MSYPHIDPKTYLRLQEHDFAKSPDHFSQPRIFAVGSRPAVICNTLGNIVASGMAHIRTAFRRTTSVIVFK